MIINGKQWRTISYDESNSSLIVIDQSKLPHCFTSFRISSCNGAARAISEMIVRGAPLIGVTGAYGLMLALKEDPSDSSLRSAISLLKSTRPTAVNLHWALQRVFEKIRHVNPNQRAYLARVEADLIAEEDVAMCEEIGAQGLCLLKELLAEKQKKTSQMNEVIPAQKPSRSTELYPPR